METQIYKKVELTNAEISWIKHMALMYWSGLSYDVIPQLQNEIFDIYEKFKRLENQA